VFLTQDRDEWTTRLSAADTCVAPVLTIPETVDDEQFVARGDFVEAHHHEQGTFRQVGPVFAGMAHPTEPYEARDATVTDTDELLTDAGLSVDELAKLHEAGVIA
jgi:alpha-methylacyl-CoA racemase